MLGMSSAASTWWRFAEWWNRHVWQRELYRQLDAVREDFTARSSWIDELSDEEVEEIHRALDACVEAIVEGVGEAEGPPVEGTS
ncbi:hypothetical protein ACFU7T_08850 [Streptomyces sp. NPDC057555]|uniref:hypothetical protein n=1 Tax=Streptomyces sp. NPDC057555 TaxID=3346166 RepID=UPI00368D78CF